MLTLIAKKRDVLGKSVKSLRFKGFIPAEIYGRDFPNIHLSLPEKDFEKVFKSAGESSVIKLEIEGQDKKEKEMNVMVHDVTHNSITGQILHVDFHRVRMDEKITAALPVKFIGESQAVKELSGVLVKAMQEIEVEALPGDLPQGVDVDLVSLTNIGLSIYVKDIKMPAGVRVLIDPDTVVATVIEQAKEEVEEKPMTVEDVKVEGEVKKEEGQAETAPDKKEEKKEKE